MEYRKYLIAFVVLAILADSATCDYYSSISGLEILLEAEEYLLDSLKEVIDQQADIKNVKLLRELDHIEKEHIEATNDSFAYLSNPISAFKLIKRFVVDWTELDEYVKKYAGPNDLDIDLRRVLNDDFRIPTEYDLNGAALGMMRLQETYDLNTTDLADGKILGTKCSSEMSVSDCMELGLCLYEAKQYKQSLAWFLEALAKLKRKSFPPKNALTELLRYISVIFFYLGNPKMALLLGNEILRIDPTHEDALENNKIYEEEVFKQRNLWKRSYTQPIMKPKEPSMKEVYEMTCRGERHQTPQELRPLRCMYMTNGKPYRLIAPFKVEQLNLDPLVVYYYDVINDSQIKTLIELGEPIIERSRTGELTKIISEVRTSKTGWLYYDKHTFLDSIAILLNDITGLSLSTAEALQIVNYGIGGHYAPHWDFSVTPNTMFAESIGNRLATALFYLNDVELGGATAFPFLKLAVPSIKRSLVMWYNLHDSLEPDFRSKHAGCPVLKGSKWILNEWYHERGHEFIKPCGLNQQGHISKHYYHIR